MPVTAKFSEEFYEKLGHGIVNEFVDWFNHMDLAYKTELRDQNELNFQRFEAVLRGEISGVGWEMGGVEGRLEKRIAGFGDRLEKKIAGVEGRLEKKISTLAQEIGNVESRLSAKIDSDTSSLRAEMVAMKAEIIKWMFLFWSGTALTVIGVMVALTR